MPTRFLDYRSAHPRPPRLRVLLAWSAGLLTLLFICVWVLHTLYGAAIRAAEDSYKHDELKWSGPHQPSGAAATTTAPSAGQTAVKLSGREP